MAEQVRRHLGVIVGPPGMLDALNRRAMNVVFSDGSGQFAGGLLALTRSDVDPMVLENELRELAAGVLLGSRFESTREGEAMSYALSHIYGIYRRGELPGDISLVHDEMSRALTDAFNVYESIEQIGFSTSEAASVYAGLINDRLVEMGLQGGTTEVHLGVTVEEDGRLNLCILTTSDHFPRVR